MFYICFYFSWGEGMTLPVSCVFTANAFLYNVTYYVCVFTYIFVCACVGLCLSYVKAELASCDPHMIAKQSHTHKYQQNIWFADLWREHGILTTRLMVKSAIPVRRVHGDPPSVVQSEHGNIPHFMSYGKCKICRGTWQPSLFSTPHCLNIKPTSAG